MSERKAKWLLAAIAAALIVLGYLNTPAKAQTTFTMPPPAGVFLGGYQVVVACGGAALSANNLAFGTMDTTGVICTSSTGGGGGAVTIADGADVTQGAKADAACGTATGTCSLIALIKYLNTSVNAAIPAGTNLIGDVNLRQGGTALSTTNGAYFNQLQGNAVLSATNGSYANILQGNAVLSQASNPLPVSSDPCQGAAKTTAAFSSSSGGPVSIVALSGSTKVYICAIAAITDTAIKLSFIDGTGGSCASAQHALIGSTTAANGMSLAANGGFTLGSGNGTVAVTAAASAFCFLQSGTSLVAGTVTYVQQ